MPDLLDKITSLFRPKPPEDPRISKLKDLFLNTYMRQNADPEQFLGDIVPSQLPGGSPLDDARVLNAFRDQMIANGPIHEYRQGREGANLLDPAKEYPYFNLAMADGLRRKLQNRRNNVGSDW